MAECKGACCCMDSCLDCSHHTLLRVHCSMPPYQLECCGDVSCVGNILLASTSTVPHGFAAKVSDFGLAREMDIQSRIATKTTGTVTYMPPETIADGMVSKVCH